MTEPKPGQIKLAMLSRNLQLSEKLYNFGANASMRAGMQKMASVQEVEKLREFSITTLEEAVALARVQPEALGRVIGDDVVSALRKPEFQKSAAASSPIINRFERLEKPKLAFGARIGDRPSSLPAAIRHEAELTGSTPPLGNAFHLLGGPCMPPIRDQGQRWTCVAFATCAVVEFEICRSQERSIDTSEQFQYWNCKNYESSYGPGTYTSLGTYPDISFALSQRDGICRKSVWPYDPVNDPAQHDPHATAGLADPRKAVIRNAVAISKYRDLPTLKGYLRAFHPVAIAIPVYDSWEQSAMVVDSGNISMPLPGETSTAGHALVLVGYEDNPEFAGGGFFIIRNSWGSAWGPHCLYGAGYGTLPYRYISSYNYSAHIVRA